MFGYVRPNRGELKVRELEAYRGAYCGLCHALKRRCGFAARFLVNYDFTLLAMLLSPGEEVPPLERRRCVRCPLRGRAVCRGNDGLDTAADESMILTWWKLRDSILDGGFWERLRGRALCLALRGGYRRAAAARPDFDARVGERLEKLHRLERENCPSLDRAADTFAGLLRAAAPQSGDTDRDRALGQLLYHVGRWIYIVDAWDDLEEDAASGSYNPIRARFGAVGETEREQLRATLGNSVNLALSAFELLDLGCWGGIVENILRLGLPGVEELVFSGRWKDVKNGRGATPDAAI